MIKISGNVYKPNTYDGFSRNISFIINRRTSSDQTFSAFLNILAIEEKNLKKLI